MKRFLTLSILLFIVGFINNAYAPNVSDKFNVSDKIPVFSDFQSSNAPNVPKKFDVRVDLTSEDESTKNLIESYIKRELRSLQDVNIIPEKIYATYILALVIAEPTYEASGRKTGSIAISYVFKEKFSAYKELIPYLIKECPKLEDASKQLAIRLKTINLDIVHNHGVSTSSTEDVTKLCKGIVADFDIEVLEKQRAKR